MISWNLKHYTMMYSMLEGLIAKYREMVDSPEPIEADVAAKDPITDVLALVIKEAKILQLEPVHRFADKMVLELLTSDYNAVRLVFNLERLQALLSTEITGCKLIFIPTANPKYAGQDKLLGEAAYNSFENARQDVRNVANCLALSLPTASVFHLLRAASYGWHKLAEKLDISPMNGQESIVEVGDWEKLLRIVGARGLAARDLPPGPIRRRDMALYDKTSRHCLEMKQTWQDHLDRALGTYSFGEAIELCPRVQAFLQFVAKKFK